MVQFEKKVKKKQAIKLTDQVNKSTLFINDTFRDE